MSASYLVPFYPDYSSKHWCIANVGYFELGFTVLLTVFAKLEKKSAKLLNAYSAWMTQRFYFSWKLECVGVDEDKNCTLVYSI